eukprot:4943003-Prymnesium_polylepis.1
MLQSTARLFAGEINQANQAIKPPSHQAIKPPITQSIKRDAPASCRWPHQTWAHRGTCPMQPRRAGSRTPSAS